MLSDNNTWRFSHRTISGLMLSSALIVMSACTVEENPGSSSAQPSSSTGTSSSTPTSTPSSSSTGTSSSTGNPNTGAWPDDSTPGKFRVNSDGRITEDGSVFEAQCGAWFGLEGQHEPKDADNNPDGAPMELYIGNMWWVESGRTIEQTMEEIKDMGINMIRLPIAPQTLDSSDPQGTGSAQDGGVLKNDLSAYPYDNAREAMEEFIILADQYDLKVMVDIHSCSNYLGWRAGRLDSNPPYVDATREGYEFTRESYSCGGGATNDHPYNESRWLEDLREIAGLPDALGVDNIIGIDLFNEPWDYTWDEWATLSEKAFDAIDGVNSDLLLFVQGIGSGLQDETEIPHGVEETNPNWGENFYGFHDRPLEIPRNRVVISPHTYGPSVFVQGSFMNGECSELEGDEAAHAECQIDIMGNQELLVEGWEEHFGFLRDMNYAIVIGEYGGNMDWPQGTREAEREMWGHITDNVDEDWQNVFTDYMIEHQIEGCYWSINPESGDTGGLYLHEYDPVDNEEGWGTWEGFDDRKVSLLQRLWDGY